MRKPVFCVLVLAALAAGDEVKRPKITGVAHMALYVSDLAKARAFYEDFLGYAEPYALKKADGSDRIAFIKINEDQYLELFAEAPQHNDGQLNHISVATDDAQGMRDYLAVEGRQGAREHSAWANRQPRISTSTIRTATPSRSSSTSRTAGPATREGNSCPDTRISTRVAHVGILIGPLERATKFYRDILGFQRDLAGRGIGARAELGEHAGARRRGLRRVHALRQAAGRTATRGKNHICLVVPDIENAVAALRARPAYKAYGREIEIRTGVNRKRQANLFDPDGTRVELMEPKTVDGKPTPPSTAPPPMP